MNLDFDAVKAEAETILRDEDGIYAQELNHALRYALRILQEQGVLSTQSEMQMTLPADVWDLPLEQFGRAEIVQIDWAWAPQTRTLWYRLQKSPYQGADFNYFTPPVGRPYRWSLWGAKIIFDGRWDSDSLLHIRTERSFSGEDEYPQISSQYYDAVLQLTVAYVQTNYLNIDSSSAQNQAAAAVQRLLEARDRQLSSGEIQPFIY